jgi:hypothetical protein
MHKYCSADQRFVYQRRLRLLPVFMLLVLALACSRPADPQATTAVNTDPDQLLKQMSQKLGGAKMLSFKVNRQLEPALTEGRNIADISQIEISVARPGKFLAKSESKDDVRHIFFDGENLSIYDEAMKLYATAALPGTIDEFVAKVDEKYGFTPPLAEFILSDTYSALSRHIKSNVYKGKENVAGIECHHLTLSGAEADSELWLGTADLLPRKLVATFKNREGNPKLEADFSSWNLSPTLDDKMFAFVAPKDAEKIDMITEAQMKEASAKAEKEGATTKK